MNRINKNVHIKVKNADLLGNTTTRSCGEERSCDRLHPVYRPNLAVVKHRAPCNRFRTSAPYGVQARKLNRRCDWVSEQPTSGRWARVSQRQSSASKVVLKSEIKAAPVGGNRFVVSQIGIQERAFGQIVVVANRKLLGQIGVGRGVFELAV